MSAVLKPSVADVCVSFFHIPQHEFTEAVAHELVETLFRRIEQSNFSHRECGVEALEYLRDAASILGAAAEDIEVDDWAAEKLAEARLGLS